MCLKRSLASSICTVLISFSTATSFQKQPFVVKQNKQILSEATLIESWTSVSKPSCAAACTLNKACCQAHYNIETKLCIIHSSYCMEMEQDEGSHLIQKVIKKDKAKPADCSELPACSCNGVYRIYPGNSVQGFDVYCEDGWTVIQKRFDGTTNFFRNWADYKDGFGNISGEYWLGNDKLHTLTRNKNYSIRFDFIDINDQQAYAIYKTFSVADQSMKYRMTVGLYNGTAGNSFEMHSGNEFTTIDNDNDLWPGGNCAGQRHGGYWYKDCGWTNLNGEYKLGQTGTELMIWEHWQALNSLKSSVMKLK